MKLKELIERLRVFNPEIEVMVNGYEGGLVSEFGIRISKAELNYNSEIGCYGPHAENPETGCNCIILDREGEE